MDGTSRSIDGAFSLVRNDVLDRLQRRAADDAVVDDVAVSGAMARKAEEG
jgi:hypothetical protein